MAEPHHSDLGTPANPREEEAVVTVIVAVDALVHTTASGWVAVTLDILKSR